MLGTAGKFLLIRPTSGKRNITWRNAAERNKEQRNPEFLVLFTLRTEKEINNFINSF